MHNSDAGSQREGEVSEAGGGWAELEVSRSPKAVVAHVILQNNTHSPCLPLVFRRHWNFLAGLSVQIHSKLISVSSMGNFGQDPCHLPFS